MLRSPARSAALALWVGGAHALRAGAGPRGKPQAPEARGWARAGAGALLHFVHRQEMIHSPMYQITPNYNGKNIKIYQINSVSALTVY